eukprot:Phypoly_transcript_10933.p1 GENE.Phypoly_transcript_10933~~Phypoly_transcript_10933.p1  ORF type:complete len:288 (+),score=65.44 Phypoly_transcript_10933:100-963(+)
MPLRAHVKIIEARNLKSSNFSGFCDPLCKVQIGDDKKKSHKTKAVKKTLNPKWQETFVFEGVSKADKLEVEVRHWNVVNSKVIGTASYSFSSLPAGLKPQEIWLPIKEGKDTNAEAGEVHLLVVLATAEDAVDLDGVRLASHQEVEEGNSIFIVEILEGRNLAVKDLSGTSDPYCVLQILPPLSSSSGSGSPPSSSVKQRTCIVFKSLDPVWNEEFFFQIPFSNGTLEVEVWDWDRIGSHDAMGVVRVPLSKFADELVHDNWYLLSPIKKEKVSGDIRMRTQFTSAL